jgi:hypothetical protein
VTVGDHKQTLSEIERYRSKPPEDVSGPSYRDRRLTPFDLRRHGAMEIDGYEVFDDGLLCGVVYPTEDGWVTKMKTKNHELRPLGYRPATSYRGATYTLGIIWHCRNH